MGLGQSLAPFWLLCYSTRLSLFLGAEPTRETSRGPSLIAKAPQSSQEPPPRQEPPWGLRSQELPHQPVCNGGVRVRQRQVFRKSKASAAFLQRGGRREKRTRGTKSRHVMSGTKPHKDQSSPTDLPCIHTEQHVSS